MNSNQDPPQQSGPLSPFIDPAQSSESLLGKKLGEFEILKELGRGGSAIVYEAAQPSLKRSVALKVLWRPLSADTALVERFHYEAESAAGLHHPNIVPIYAMGQENGLVYFAMEKIDGETLDSLLLKKKFFDPGQATQIIKYVARAVSYAHQNGVIHRDIKPSNIMIDRIGRVLVTDFGLAKSKKKAKITSDSVVMGTPVYMSAEQAQGREADARTDIYSMGVVLYEMVTGEVPFDAQEPIAILRKVIDEKPRRPRQINKSIPKNVETLILKCIEKAPSNRYQTAGVFLRDLELSKMNLPLTASYSELTISSDTGRRNILKLFFVLLVSIILSGSFILAYNAGRGYLKQIHLPALKIKAGDLPGVSKKENEAAFSAVSRPPALTVKELADAVYLKDGLKVMGIIESADENGVTLRLKIGTATYPKERISKIEYSTPSNRQQLLELWGKD